MTFYRSGWVRTVSPYHAGITMLLPIEKASASSSKSAAVRAGQYFVIVDVSVPGGKWIDDILYKGTRGADKKADMYRKVRDPSMWERYPYDAGLQVIDAVYFSPSEEKLRVLGMRAAGSPKAAWAKGEEGRKQWEVWFKEQPQEFQDKWNEMNELYGDVVKDQYKKSAEKLPEDLEENKWTDSDGDNPPPNPKGSDADGDGKTNEPKPFKAAAKSSDFMPGERVVYWVHGKGTVVDVWNEYGKTGITIEWDNGDVSNPMDRSRLMSDLQKLEGDLELAEGDVIELSNGDQGTVERVRKVDAWVAFPYGATRVPLKSIKKVVTKYRRRRSAATTIGSGKNGYIAMYKGKKVEVMADTKLEAQQVAAAHFKARKSYEVDVYLAEVDGKPYSHMPMFASEQEAEKMEAEAEASEAQAEADREKADAARVVANMLRNAFVPDSVVGHLEWEDGTRVAVTRRRG